MGQRRWFKTRDKVEFKIYYLQDPVLSPILKHEGVDLNGHEMMMINMESKQGRYKQLKTFNSNFWNLSFDVMKM